MCECGYVCVSCRLGERKLVLTIEEMTTLCVWGVVWGVWYRSLVVLMVIGGWLTH